MTLPHSALSLLVLLSLSAGCTEGSASSDPETPTGASGSEASQGGERADDDPERQLPASAAVACDEASVSLVGHYSLTRYPGQDDVGPNGERPMGMSKEYEFTANQYTMEGYPPLRVTGRYEVLERDGMRQRVRFYDTVFDGRPDQDRELWLVFEDCGATLQMDGMTYTRRPDA